ncbi:MAG: DUF2007 domain-containing protein [Polyangiaceae bacterium]
MSARDEKWIEIRRYNDPVEADMARDFLKMHDVRVSIRGNSGATGVLNRFDTILDIRLVVPESEIDRAREALEAMQSPPPTSPSSAYRGLNPGSREGARKIPDEEKIPDKKSPFASIGFGLIFPIGAGHTYADHREAGKIFGLAILGSALVAVITSTSWLWVTVFAIALTDALASPFAVTRFNLGKVSPVSKQRTWAFVAVLVAIAIGYLTRD